MNCPSCGAALAEDQRYCLNCGQRQGDARVDFRRHLEPKALATKEPPTESKNGSGSPGALAPVAAGPQPEKPQRDYAPLAAAGGIAVLGIMLLIGVLIGRGTGGNESSETPQVVTVPAAESSANAGAGQSSTGSDAGKRNNAGKSGKNQNAAAGGNTATSNAPPVSDETLEALDEKSGEEYSKESAKLPDEIPLPGEAPAEDNKAPGGGSGGVTLE